ncbi:MAG: hypothetical protein L0K95_13700 [Tetragenococcus koreensis]|nr:hypothetical protein [Tetragenococcus koreensis]MDN6750875.1 hypothetical protein [Staphylococcus equorum]MDN6268556.1 hypothetical protein [Tetragenococcus koreensis]MDN6502010.1 hypothetical protein [Tetragenococcus koreensis]MDN6580799.1 hypothetical protein [Tetragenococcus koreensis]
MIIVFLKMTASIFLIMCILLFIVLKIIDFLDEKGVQGDKLVNITSALFALWGVISVLITSFAVYWFSGLM